MSAITHELKAAHVSHDSLKLVSQLADDLPESELRDLLSALVTNIKDGTDVSLLPADHEFTPSQLAKHLRMSRTHLYKLLDEGAIPSHRVGRDRRIRFEDVIAFEKQRQRDRRELAERFAHTHETREGAVDELLESM